MPDLKPADRVFITGPTHPHRGKAGELIAFEQYGPAMFGWTGWRVKLDGWDGECYANPSELMGPGRVDSMQITMKRKRRKK